jgi:O-antigen/teichoic acid export membrane protein
MVVGDVGTRVISLMFGVILARLLLPSDFGLVVTAQILTGALNYVAAVGMSDAIIRAKSISERDIRTAFTAQLTVALVLTAFIIGIAPWFAHLFREDRLTAVLQVSALAFLLRPFMHIPLALLQRAERFRDSSILLFITVTTTGVTALGMALIGLGVWSLVVSGIIGSLVRIVVAARMVGWLPGLGMSLTTVHALGAFGLRVSAIDFVRYIRTQTVNGVVSRSLGVADVGQYNKADSLSQIPQEVFADSAYRALFRKLAIVSEDIAESRRLFLKAISVVTFYSLPFYALLLVWPEQVVTTLFGPNWAPSAPALQILAVAGLVGIVTVLSSAVTAARDLLRIELRIQVGALLVCLIGAVVGLRWGILGVAVGVLPGHVLLALGLYGVAAHSLGLRISHLFGALRPVATLAVSAAAAGVGAYWALRHLGLPPDHLFAVAGIALSSACVYATHLLLWPPSGLAEQAAMWRSWLLRAAHLARK